MTEENIPHLPPPYNGDASKKSSKKWIYWSIGIISVLAISLIVGIQVAKYPTKDLQVYDEDPPRAMLSEDEWREAEEYAERHGHTDDTQDWEKLYMRDEFGEEITSMPYIRRNLSGYKIYGQSGQSDYSNLIITLDPRYGIELKIGSGEFNGNDRIIIKHGSGDREEIPYEILDDGNIRITDPTNIKHFVDILQSGDIEMAIAGDTETRYYNFSINDEFKNIRKALRFLRDVPDVESIYGTIN